ncbi:MAG: transporter [Sulfuritalea sp.]|nr:transporter [Sulfuritalea sp.]
MHIKHCRKIVVAFAVCISAPPALADNQGFSLGIGYNYSSGDYGTATTTNTTSIPVTGSYETGPWTLKLTVPYLTISGDSSVVPGVGVVRNSNPRGRGKSAGAPATTTTTGSASGMGDVVMAATYGAYYDNTSKIGIDLTGKVKFGTADRDKGLGTGENDYSMQLDLYKGLDKFGLFGGIGYSVLGSSDYVQLDNVYNVTAGVTYKFAERTTAGVSFDARERVSSTAFPMREISAFVSHKYDKNWKAQAYVLKGLADGSPDWGLGLSAAYAF